MSNPACTARQHSDQMICEACGLQWDVNDPEPPKCAPDQTVEFWREYRLGSARRYALKQIARLGL